MCPSGPTGCPPAATPTRCAHGASYAVKHVKLHPCLHVRGAGAGVPHVGAQDCMQCSVVRHAWRGAQLRRRCAIPQIRTWRSRAEAWPARSAAGLQGAITYMGAQRAWRGSRAACARAAQHAASVLAPSPARQYKHASKQARSRWLCHATAKWWSASSSHMGRKLGQWRCDTCKAAQHLFLNLTAGQLNRAQDRAAHTGPMRAGMMCSTSGQYSWQGSQYSPHRQTCNSDSQHGVSTRRSVVGSHGSIGLLACPGSASPRLACMGPVVPLDHACGHAGIWCKCTCLGHCHASSPSCHASHASRPIFVTPCPLHIPWPIFDPPFPSETANQMITTHFDPMFIPRRRASSVWLRL